jgi:uncharacterized membrane protein YgcG
MAAKPNSKNWNDVQLAIVSIALVLTLFLWNSFAGLDRIKAEGRADEEAAPMNVSPTPALAVAMPTMPSGVIMLADATPTPMPSTTTTTKKDKGGGGGRGGSGGGGGGGGTGGS